MMGNEKTRRLIRFLISGGAGAVTFFGLLIIMVEWLKIDHTVATCIAFVIAVLQNYAFHYNLTFRSEKGHRWALPRFVVASVIGFFLNGGVVWLGTSVAGLHYLLAQFVAAGFVVLSNYVLAVLWVF